MWSVIVKGGPIMWPIIICSIWGLAIIIDKLIYLYRTSVDTSSFLKKIFPVVKDHQIREALDICEANPIPIASILKSGILKYDYARKDIREAMEDASLYQIPRLEKNLAYLATIAHISPLLGLLGTVTGMVKSFQVIQMKATSFQPMIAGDLAGGIWEALLTTVVGLVVAIPAFFAYNYLVNRVNNIILHMEKNATELLDILSDKKSRE